MYCQLKIIRHDRGRRLRQRAVGCATGDQLAKIINYLFHFAHRVRMRASFATISGLSDKRGCLGLGSLRRAVISRLDAEPLRGVAS